MIRGLKSVFALFLLAAFLFPSLVKEVHAVSHEQRVNCNAENEKHLHVQDHNCDLCDFVLPVMSAAVADSDSFFHIAFAEYIFTDHTSIFFSATDFFSGLLRAPPFIS